MQYTKGGNLKAPSHSNVNSWFQDAWQSVKLSNIDQSILSAGFDEDYKNWHISKHDVYRDLFKEAWENRDDIEVQPEQLELIPQLDDLIIGDAE